MSNKALGNTFEARVIARLQECGFWVHLLKDNHNGQPFDIIAIGEEYIWCIDAKHCVGNRFNFSNIRENQKEAFEYLGQFKNEKLFRGFIIGDTELHVLPYNDYKLLAKKGHKSIIVNMLNKL